MVVETLSFYQVRLVVINDHYLTTHYFILKYSHVETMGYLWHEDGGNLDFDVLWSEDDLEGNNSGNEISGSTKRKLGDNEGSPTEQLIKKKRIRKKHRFPRVVKSDLRRFLGLMFVNTMNSADLSLITQFFGQFCLSSCTTEYSVRKKPFERLEGVQPTVDHTVQHLSRIPDLVLNIDCNSIVQRAAESGSRIVLKVTLKGTDLSPPNFDSALSFQFSAQYTFSLDLCHRILKIEFDGDFDENLVQR